MRKTRSPRAARAILVMTAAGAAWCGAQPAADQGLVLEKRLEAVPKFGIQFCNVVEVDPARYRIKTVSAAKLLNKKRASVPKIMKVIPEAVAAINAGFFPTDDAKNRPSDTFDGFFIEEGRKQAHNNRQKRVFYVTDDGRPGIAMAAKVPGESIESAVAGLTSGKKADGTARSAVCITKGGRVKLVTAYPVKTLAAMTRFLRQEEDCADYVHLDGGGSSQMAYDDGKESFITGWERHEQCYKGEEEQPPECFRMVTSALVVVPAPR